jgi:hypothetical protein
MFGRTCNFKLIMLPLFFFHFNRKCNSYCKKKSSTDTGQKPSRLWVFFSENPKHQILLQSIAHPKFIYNVALSVWVIHLFYKNNMVGELSHGNWNSTNLVAIWILVFITLQKICFNCHQITCSCIDFTSAVTWMLLKKHFKPTSIHSHCALCSTVEIFSVSSIPHALFLNPSNLDWTIIICSLFSVDLLLPTTHV